MLPIVFSLYDDLISENYWLYTKCWGKERAYKINLKNFQKK